MEHSKSLAPHTGKVFDAISRLECIKPFTLVGGTALSLQIEKRHSEDLDFMLWQKKKKDKCDVNWPDIKKELESVVLAGAAPQDVFMPVDTAPPPMYHCPSP